MIIERPARTEAAEYYFKYIDRVNGEVLDVMRRQRDESIALFKTISDERSRTRYAEGKWSVRELLSHINDTERVFAHRAFWFGRGLSDALPSFDQDVAVAASSADERPWLEHVEEFAAIRASSISLFGSLPDDAWSRTGVASGNSVTVRALAFITAGHLAHHLAILRERYLSR
jgi:hypothetical protein